MFVLFILIGQLHIVPTGKINKQVKSNWLALTEELNPFYKEI